jgi:hypothetical protein
MTVETMMMVMMSNKSQPINKWPVDSRAATWQASDRLSTLSVAFFPTPMCQDSVTDCHQLLQLNDHHETVHYKYYYAFHR